MTCSGGGENDCLSCSSTLYFEHGRCTDQCSIGFYQNDNSHSCDSCPETCLTCTSRKFFFLSFSSIRFNNIFLATSCTTCVSDYSQFGGECVNQCPDGFTSNNDICSRIFFFSLFFCRFFLVSFHFIFSKIIETQMQTQNRGIPF